MADRLGINRGSFAATDVKSAARAVRMTLVATAGIGVLVALPGWLRALEAAPSLALHEEAGPPEVIVAPVIDAPAGDDLIADAVAVDPPAAVAPFGDVPVGDVPIVAATHVVPSVPAVKLKAEQPQREMRYRALADFLAKRYRVSRDSLERFVRLAFAAGHSLEVDPLLILAVMAVESSFNPVAESVVGAKGLMQIMPQYHLDKLQAPHGGLANVLDPEVNITAGAKVLREYAQKTGEDLAATLRLYGGVGADPESPYPRRVLSERERLEKILRKIQERPADQPSDPSPDQA